MIETKEVLKYLRTASGVEDAALLSLIEQCKQTAYEAVKPRTIYEIFPCTVGETYTEIAGIRFESTRLADNLRGCKRVAVFAATLGTGADRLLRSAGATSTAEVMVYQAVFAAMVEEVCDNLEENIKAAHHCELRQRYSPGYFDLKLETQKDFFKLIDITKRIGVTLSENMLMIPSKSVTAFIGVENED